MKKIYTAKSFQETQKIGEDLAQKIIKTGPQKQAKILCLSGNLGGGKTTFLQGFATGLGIKEKILSPTFVILKHFKITRNSKFEIRNSKFTDLYHIDCYRLNSENDILELDFKNIIKNPENIVAIEWPEKIYPSGHREKVLPQKTINIDFKFVDEQTREIKLEM